MQDLLENLPADNNDSIIEFCNRFLQLNDSELSNEEDHYAKYLEAIAALEVLLEARYKYGSDLIEFEATGEINEDIQKIINCFKTTISNIKFDDAEEIYKRHRSRYEGIVNKGFSYRFEENEVEKIQTLINQLRNLITKTELVDDNHKTRLLKRLENLQSEIHKSISDLDRFWGLVGDAGVVLKKFGEDAQPIVDRVKEITEIVWNVQTKAEGLPLNTPFPSLVGNKSIDK